MSRAYRIRAAASLTHHSRVEDGIQAQLELLDILGPDRTAALLGDALAEKGWSVTDGVARKELGEAVAEVELATGRVRLTASAEEQVEIDGELSKQVYEEHLDGAQKDLEQRLSQKLARDAKAHDEAVGKRLGDALERALIEIKPELDEVTDQVTRASLREKADQLGEVLDVSENPETGEMTIRVKV